MAKGLFKGKTEGGGGAGSKRNLTDVVAGATLSSVLLGLPVEVEIKTLRATIIATSRDPVVGSRTEIRVAN